MIRWTLVDQVPREKGIVLRACLDEQNFSLVWCLLSAWDFCLLVCPTPLYLS